MPFKEEHQPDKIWNLLCQNKFDRDRRHGWCQPSNRLDLPTTKCCIGPGKQTHFWTNDFWIHGASIFLGHLHVKGCYVLVQNYYRNYSSSSKTSFKTFKKGTRAQPKVILFSLRLWNVTDKTAHPTIKQWKMITKLVSKMNYCSGWPSNVSQAPWTATKKTWGKTKYKYPGNVVV